MSCSLDGETTKNHMQEQNKIAINIKTKCQHVFYTPPPIRAFCSSLLYSNTESTNVTTSLRKLKGSPPLYWTKRNESLLSTFPPNTQEGASGWVERKICFLTSSFLFNRHDAFTSLVQRFQMTSWPICCFPLFSQLLSLLFPPDLIYNNFSGFNIVAALT